MSNQDFQERLERIGGNGDMMPSSSSVGPISRPAPSRLPRFLVGGAVSALIMAGFHNLQAISDAAPEAIRDSSTPGILGLPIALMSGLWIVYVCHGFVKGVTNSATGRGSMFPFKIGAFLGVAGYFVLFHTSAFREHLAQ